MLSKAARRLYERLLDLGPVGWSDGPVSGPDDPRLIELVGSGLAETTAEYIGVIPPDEARLTAIKSVSEHCRHLLEESLAIEDFLQTCRHDKSASAGARLVSDPNELRHLSGRMVTETVRELRSVHTFDDRPGIHPRQMGPSAAEPLADVSFRIIYPAALVHDSRRRDEVAGFVEGGEQARIHPSPPLKFKISDGAAVLVPLDSQGAAGGLLIKAPALCSLFVDYFEKLWAESTPFDATRTNASTLLNPLQTRILGFIADDMLDLAIARKLDVSERTVRRHVGIIMDKLGARTRAGAVVMALERGLLAR